ncbi:unnamed protein product [Mytilus coruscus]|uniref:C1q domain-containing protein n=1 Tax=Mytilus coruscus TaxID=42192 RepID=A0A6J8D9L3_MYTCO|nr:unnamed protein product [Mytilus coruscus]
MASFLLLVLFLYSVQAEELLNAKRHGQDSDLRQVLEELEYLRADVRHIKDEFRKLETENKKLKQQTDSVQNVNEVLLKDVNYLRKENVELKTHINTIVSNQNHETINNIEQHTGTSERMMSHQTKSLQHHIKHSNNRSREQFETNHVINKRLLLPSVTPTPAAHILIAFTAILSKDVILGPLQTVEYDKVFTNIGHGYDSRHGHFTAPIHGVYIIAATSCSYDGNVLRTEIVRNGVQLVAMYGADWDMGGHTIFIELNKDDMIWVRHLNEGQQTIHSEIGYLYSSFSGALLSSF